MSTERENAIDDIRNTLLDAYHNTYDMNGPDFEYMATRVYDLHVAPPKGESR